MMLAILPLTPAGRLEPCPGKREANKPAEVADRGQLCCPPQIPWINGTSYVKEVRFATSKVPPIISLRWRNRKLSDIRGAA